MGEGVEEERRFIFSFPLFSGYISGVFLRTKEISTNISSFLFPFIFSGEKRKADNFGGEIHVPCEAEI